MRKAVQMAGTAPRLPEPFRGQSETVDFEVSELLADSTGAHSPYGDLEFPMAPDKLLYEHPKPANRPNLAGGR